MKDFLIKHRKEVLLAIVALALASGGFALGRFGTAEKVVYRDVEKKVEVEKVVEKIVEKVVEKKVFVDNSKTRVRREEVVVKALDGTETTKKTEVIDVATDIKDTAEKQEVKTVYVDREKKVEVEKKVFVEKMKPSPDWEVSLLAGVSVPSIPDIANFDIKSDFAFGAQIERRIVGPVSLGVWGLNTGVGGVSLSLEF
jgi:hypothetical protein